VPLVHLLWPPFAASELTPPLEGTFVKAGGISVKSGMSYVPSWAHDLGGYQDRLLGGPLGLLGLCHTAPDGVGCKDYGGGVLGSVSCIM
jgi:hypothetical protein